MILEILLSSVLTLSGIGPDVVKASGYFEKGLYEAARACYQSLPDGPVNDGYELLCSIFLQSDDTDALYESYFRKYGSTSLSSRIMFERGCELFDKGDYPGALMAFEGVNEKQLEKSELPELAFKKGFCHFSAGIYPEAGKEFRKVDGFPDSEWSAPSRYELGFMDYENGNFESAVRWFELARTDSRFRNTSDYYLIECRFLLKDYDYVIESAEKVFDSLPQTRQERLARLLSESYLVRGNKEKALAYYDLASTENLSRSDYFYGGSVLYAVEDYHGAIDNFSRMKDFSDSLGQIASYHMANAYLKTRNKVGALEAFRQASVLDYDSVMQEDAFLNYAKLAYDINQDNAGFESYIAKYSTSKRGELIYSYMALTSLNRRDYAAAVEAYDNIDELDSDMRGNYMKANFLRGIQLYESGAYRDAVPCLRAAAFYLPNQNRFNQLSRFWLAECYYKNEQFEEAENIYTGLYNVSALQSNLEGALLPYNLAYSYFNQAKFENAARWFDVYTSSGAALYKEDALMRRADCDFLNRDYKSAIDSYQVLIDMESGGLYPMYRQAMSYGLLGDKKSRLSKISVLSEAVLSYRDDPMFKEALYELGRAYMENKDTGKALASFKDLLEASDGDIGYTAKALIGLGMVNRNAGNSDQALEYYKRVVSDMQGTEYADDALLAIEAIYQAKKQPQKYLEYVESNSLNAKKSEKDREMLYFNTAEQLFLAKDYQQAVVAGNKYIEIYPEGEKVPETWFYIAESYKATGAKEKACDCYQKVAALAPGSSFAEFSLLNYANISYELEHFKDAYRGYSFLLSSAKLESNVSVARTGLMRSAFKGREFSDAISWADTIAAADSLSPELSRETDYVRAKSYLSLSQRTESLQYMRKLALSPGTEEGAEASYFIIADMFDRGDFDAVEKAVYDFTESAGQQSYWLARSFITLGQSFLERNMPDQAEATFISVRDGYEAPEGGDDILEIVNAAIERLNSLKKQL